MAGETSIKVGLEYQDLIDGIDEAAARFEKFSQQAEESIDKVDKASSKMSTNQQRVFQALKRSHDDHVEAIKKVSARYEELRSKQQQNIKLTDEEYTELKELKKTYNSHAKSIKSCANELNRMGKETSGMLAGVKETKNSFDILKGALSGGLAIVIAKVTDFVINLGSEIVKVGMDTQRTVSQLGALANNMTSAAATYQAFNDIARNTNYDFEAVYAMGKQLISIGYSAKNAADMIQLCADYAAGVGRDVSGAEQLVETLSKVVAVGKVGEDELEQLQLAGIDLNAVFEPMGISGVEAMQALQDGTIDSQQAIDALVSYLHKFDGKMAESKNNIIDQWGDVTGNISTACGEIGASIADAFMKSEIVQDLVDFTQSLIDLIRGEGCGAFSDFGAIAQFALDVIGGALKTVYTIIKLAIIWVNELYGAFKTMCLKVYDYLSFVLEPLGEIFRIVKGLLAKVGQEISKGVDESFKMTFKPKVEITDTGNNFKKPVVIVPETSSNTERQISEEEKAVTALVKKYADAAAQAREFNKINMQTAALKASLLSSEAQLQQDLENKLLSYKDSHEALMESYQKEIALAKQIESASMREDTIAAIEKQREAQVALYSAQQQAARFKYLQDQDKDLLDIAFGDPEDINEKIGTYRTSLNDFLKEVNAMSAAGMAVGADTMSQGLTEESMGFMTKMLNMTPDQLAEEFAAKQEQFTTFADFIKTKMAEATAAEQDNLSLGEQWKNKQEEWLSSIGSSMGNAVMEWINGSKTIGQAMADMVKSLISQAMSLLAHWTATYFTLLAFSTPPKEAAKGANKMVLGIGLASGGFVRGPGTSTSDSIPAMLSNGEYVLNAAAVERLGVSTLNRINNGGSIGYADGGLAVPNFNLGTAINDKFPSSIVNSSNVSFSVSAIDANSFAGFLENGGLDTIRQALFDNGRNFATDSGVW